MDLKIKKVIVKSIKDSMNPKITLKKVLSNSVDKINEIYAPTIKSLKEDLLNKENEILELNQKINLLSLHYKNKK